METITVNCSACGRPVETLAGHPKALCERCRQLSLRVTEGLAHLRRLEEAWIKFCPDTYLDTVFDRLPCPLKSGEALSWPTTTPGHGLMLWGKTRMGKTRTMWLLLKREHFRSRRAVGFHPGLFLGAYDATTRRRGEWIDRLISADMVFWDDVDKCKFPRKVEDAFFAIVNARIASGKPCFFTGNSDGAALSLKFFVGEPLVARIREFCQIIHFP